MTFTLTHFTANKEKVERGIYQIKQHCVSFTSVLYYALHLQSLISAL